MWDSLATIPESQCLRVMGHGNSSPAQGGESFAAEVARLTALLPSPCPHLVGYSLGARLALAIAIAQPSRIQKLTLIAVTPGFPQTTERETRRAADRDWIRLLRKEGIAAFVEAWQALALWDSQLRLPAAKILQQKRQRLAHDAEQLARSLESLGTGSMPPMWATLSTLAMPVQLVVGALDEKYSAIAESMLPHFRHGTLVRIPDAGHNPVLEAPSKIASLLSQERSLAKVAQ